MTKDYNIYTTFTSRTDGRSICTDCGYYQNHHGCILQLDKVYTTSSLSCAYYNYRKKYEVSKN